MAEKAHGYCVIKTRNSSLRAQRSNLYQCLRSKRRDCFAALAMTVF
jgi:hypothetical protein